jgi:RES domain
MGPVSRRGVALPNPPSDLDGFPRFQLRKGRKLFRAHRAGLGPWWFASNDEGRFNLDLPSGTCYLAIDEETALRERLGRDMVKLNVVSAGWADETEVSRLTVQTGTQLADTCHEDAVHYGVTREISTYTGSRYVRTRKWANAFNRRGLGGVRYESRFTTIVMPNAIALFDGAGDAGRPDTKNWPVDPVPTPGREACRKAGLTVYTPPTSRQVRISPTP